MFNPSRNLQNNHAVITITRTSLILLQAIASMSLAHIFFDFSLGFVFCSTSIFALLVLTHSTLEAINVFAVSVVICSVSVGFKPIARLFEGNSQNYFLLYFLVVILFTMFLFREIKTRETKDLFWPDFISLLVLTVIPINWAERSFSSSLSFIGQSEDNAEWLQYLAGSLMHENSEILGPNIHLNSIPGLSVVNTLFQSLQNLATNRQFTHLDNVLVLVHSYGLMLSLVVASFAAFTVSALIRRNCGPATVLAMTALILVMIYEICGTILGLGHYPFLICFWLMSLGLMVNETIPELRQEKITSLLTIVLVLGAALFWQHITPVSMLISMILILSPKNRNALVEYLKRESARNRFIYVGVIAALSIPLYSFFWPQLRRVTEFDYIKKMVVIDGGVALVTNTFGFAVVIAIVLLILDNKSIWPRVNIAAYFSSFLIYLFVIQIFSKSIAPYTFHYAYQKAYVLFIFIFIPWAFLSIVLNNKVRSNYFGPILVCLMLFVMLSHEGEIDGTFRYPRILRKSQNDWAIIGSSEILKDPSRSVLCLNTSDDPKFTDMNAYECNRVLTGLQGNSEDVRFDSWSPLGIWVSPIDVLLDLPDSFYNDVTFIVPDSQSRQRGDEVIQKVIESIPWEIVKVVELPQR
jgi:hypothetical protein